MSMADTRAAEEHIIDVRPDKGYLGMKFASAALRADWKTAAAMLKEHPEEIITPSTRLGWCLITALLIATSHGRVEVVEKLVEMMDEEDLGIPDVTGDTALSISAQLGLTEIASILLKKKPDLVTIPVVRRWDGNSHLPIQIAAMSEQSAMVSHLYEFTKNLMEESNRIDLFLSLIYYGSYDVAKKMLLDYPGLAIKCNNKGETALDAIAGNVPDTVPKQLEQLNHLIDELLKRAKERPDLIKGALFIAAKEGNFALVSRALGFLPEQGNELDDNNHTVFHVGVQHRHVDVLEVLHGIHHDNSSIKQMTEREKNSLLHLAAKLPLCGLEVVQGPGAALHVLQHELLWFKNVQIVYLKLLGDPRNIRRYVLLFEKEHEELRSKAEKLLTSTANSGMIVAVLFFGGAIAGLSSVPGGGFEQDTRDVPIHLSNFWFKTYIISYAAASFFSFSAIIIFLSILISGFSMRDFQKSLPSKSLFGLLSLFVSIVAVMITVVASFYLHFDHPIPHLSCPVAVVVLMLILLASYLLLPLPVQLFRSTFMPLQFRRNRFLIR